MYCDEGVEEETEFLTVVGILYDFRCDVVNNETTKETIAITSDLTDMGNVSFFEKFRYSLQLF